eukprot:596022-Pleurochrysis_carterae.AAC.1
MLGSGSNGVGPAALLNLLRGVLSPCGRVRRTDHTITPASELATPMATFTATLLIAASPLEAICTEISISPPGALLS